MNLHSKENQMTLINALRSTSEQIQQDLLSYASSIDDEKIFFTDEVLDELCQIIVDNFDDLLK